MNIPKELKYSETHEWIRIEGKEGTIGISDFAQHELGDIVYVELPKVGQKIKVEDSCAVVESVKAASDIYSPVTGTVVRVNEALAKDPGAVNKDPYSSGWFFTVTIEDMKSVEKLLGPAEYEKILGA